MGSGNRARRRGAQDQVILCAGRNLKGPKVKNLDYLDLVVARFMSGDGYSARQLSLLAWEAFHDDWEDPPPHFAWRAMANHPGLTLLEVLEMAEAYGA